MLPFFPRNRALRPEGLLHSRGIARSGLRPLTKIPYCCLPQESGPCLSPSVAVRPLRPAMHRRLGEPLPLQPANAPQVHLHAGLLSPFPKRRCLLFAHPVSASVSRSSPAHAGRFPTCYSPVRHSYPKISVRLACIRHAASVHPEPGSNSPFDIDSFFLFSVICLDCFSGVSRNRRDFCFSRTCTIVFSFLSSFQRSSLP